MSGPLFLLTGVAGIDRPGVGGSSDDPVLTIMLAICGCFLVLCVVGLVVSIYSEYERDADYKAAGCKLYLSEPTGRRVGGKVKHDETTYVYQCRDEWRVRVH